MPFFTLLASSLLHLCLHLHYSSRFYLAFLVSSCEHIFFPQKVIRYCAHLTFLSLTIYKKHWKGQNGRISISLSVRHYALSRSFSYTQWTLFHSEIKGLLLLCFFYGFLALLKPLIVIIVGSCRCELFTRWIYDYEPMLRTRKHSSLFRAQGAGW